MLYYYDTHVHSNHSDGDFAPREVARQARASGLRGVVLADHNTIEGCEEFSAACREFGLKTCMGVEVSTKYQELEIHVLGYARQFNVEALRGGLQPVIQGYDRRSAQMVDKLREQGLTGIEFPGLRAKKSLHDPVVKYDIAIALRIERGLPQGAEKELEALVNRGGSGFVPYGDDFYGPDVACGIIYDAGGISVLAHPDAYVRKYRGTEDEKRMFVEKLIVDLQRVGLQGIEIRNTDCSPEETKYLSDLAKKLHLFTLGSTDWHGRYHHPGRVFGKSGSSEEEFHYLISTISRRK
ncbi:MAG: PHP domain-containing protein [Patescibacteria group bacterium]|nr:PHP domain-containing protein [Patescibacteria group bacterium]MDD5715908.1 PHP domain-containing protein [Patescibacteria group bacterium]